MEEKVSKEGRQEQLEEGEKYKEKTEAVEKIHQGGGRQCMEIDIWGGPRLEEKWRNRTARNMDHRGQLLTLTMGERGKESDKEVEDDKTDSQKEDTTQRMIVHHPNLSKILEKRQAMRDSITNSP